MEVNPDFYDLLKIFSEENVEYLVVGGYAVMFYTEPRFTKDIDLWIRPSSENAQKVWKSLMQFGAPLEQVNLEDFCNSELIYQIGIAPNRIDIIMDVKGVTFESAWRNRKISKYGDVDMNVIDLDDLIASKQATGRDQDILDLKRLREHRK